MLANSNGREIEKVVGAREIQYGAVGEGGGNYRSDLPSEYQNLAIADREVVARPNEQRRTITAYYQSISSALLSPREMIRRRRGGVTTGVVGSGAGPMPPRAAS